MPKFHSYLKSKREWLFPLILFIAAAISVLLLLHFGKSPQAEPSASPTEASAQTEAATEAAPYTEFVPVTETALTTEEQIEYAHHAAYFAGHDSFFMPDRSLTRSEAAILMYRLFGGSEESFVSFDDVPEDSDVYPEIAGVAAFFPALPDDLFHPNEPILREDLFAALCGITELLLPDELSYEDAPYTAFAVQNGWCYADEVSDYVPRGEAAHIFNRVLGRTPDADYLLQQSPVIFADVSPLCAYYADIMEASVSHDYIEDKRPEEWSDAEFAALKSGFYRQNGIAYYIQADGTLLTAPGLQDIPSGTVFVADESGRIYADNRMHPTANGVVFCRKNGTILKGGTSSSGCIFDENGFYTSGDAALDEYVNGVYEECLTDGMTQEEKLRACFDYVRDFHYLGRNRPLDDSVKTMSNDLARDFALKIFETGKGDCYNFTAAFLCLARGLGYNAEAIIGYCGYYWSSNAIAHGWVTITMDDGAVYLFDPQIENYNLRAGISNEYNGAYMKPLNMTNANYYPN